MAELYCPLCQWAAELPRPVVVITASLEGGVEEVEFSADREAMMREACPSCGKAGLDVRGGYPRVDFGALGEPHGE